MLGSVTLLVAMKYGGFSHRFLEVYKAIGMKTGNKNDKRKRKSHRENVIKELEK